MRDLLAGVSGATRRALAGVKDRPPGEPGWRMARRAVLGVAIGGVRAVLVRAARAAAPRPLRPPGARPDTKFTGLCIRCGNCIRACPTAILAPDPRTHGLAGLLAPVLRFESDYCREDCPPAPRPVRAGRSRA